MIDIHKPDASIIMQVQERDDSRYTRVLMGEHSVRIRFDWNNFITLPYGAYITHQGKRYSLWGEYTPLQRDGAFEYDIPFEAPECELKNFLFLYMTGGGLESKWKITAPIEQVLLEIGKNLERVYGREAWVIDNHVGASPTKLLEFDATSLFDALTQTAEAYGTEWRCDNRHITFGRMSEGKRIDLSLGDKAVSFAPQGDTAQLISRLYAFGSTRNIKSGKPLTMPSDTPYLRGVLQGKEAVKIFEDIYPKHNGIIASVTERSVKEGKVYTFTDKALKLRHDQLLPGQTLKATFESGTLNGLTFDLSIVNDGYEIVPNEEYGTRLPNDTLKPQQGDKYAPHGFDNEVVNTNYLPKAQQLLKERAFRWLRENNEDTRDVEVAINPTASLTLTIGQIVVLKNALGSGDKVGYITKIEYPLYSPESITILVGKSKPQNFIDRLKQEGKDEASLIVHELVSPKLTAQQQQVLDVQALITETNHKITETQGQVAISNGKITEALAKTATAQNTATEALSKANSIKVGGRNLVRRSLNTAPITDGYFMHTYLFEKPEGWEVGQEYTLSFVLGAKDADQGVRMYIDKWWSPREFYPIEPPKQGEDGLYYGKYVRTFRPEQKEVEIGRPRDGWDGFRLYQTDGRSNSKLSLPFKLLDVKLEKGNVATDYTAHPSDTTDAINTMGAEAKTLAVKEAGTAKELAISKAKEYTTAQVNEAKNYTNTKANEAQANINKLRAEMMQDYLRRVIKDGSTLINGGLIATNIIGMKTPEGRVSSYIDGRGVGVAFSAGVTDFATANERRVVEITHEGNAKFGQLYLSGSDGSLSFHKEREDTYLTIGGNGKDIRDLLSGKYSGDSRKGSQQIVIQEDDDRNGLQSREGIIIDAIKITKASELKISGTISFDMTQQYRRTTITEYDDEWRDNTILRPDDVLEVQTSSGTAIIKLRRKQGNTTTDIDDVAKIYGSVDPAIGSERDSKTFHWSKSIEAGEYQVILYANFDGAGVGLSQGTFSANINTALSKVDAEVHISDKALYAIFGRQNLFHVSRDGLTVKGYTDMPGVLACGRVGSSASLNYSWGAKSSTTAPSTYDNGRSVFIPHNVGHTRYSVLIPPESSSMGSYYVTNIAANSFGVIANGRCEFSYLITGSNSD